MCVYVCVCVGGGGGRARLPSSGWTPRNTQSVQSASLIWVVTTDVSGRRRGLCGCELMCVCVCVCVCVCAWVCVCVCIYVH